MCRCHIEPHIRKNPIHGNTSSISIAITQPCLGRTVALLGGLSVPCDCLHFILGKAVPFRVAKANADLRVCIPLVRSLSQPCHCLGNISGYTSTS